MSHPTVPMGQPSRGSGTLAPVVFCIGLGALGVDAGRSPRGKLPLLISFISGGLGVRPAVRTLADRTLPSCPERLA